MHRWVMMLHHIVSIIPIFRKPTGIHWVFSEEAGQS